MKTVAIIEGFAGGPIQSRAIREALTKAGYKITKNRREANVIIAHSAGIYAVPLRNKAELIMLIGPTYWPGEALLKRASRFRKQAKDFYTANFGWRFYARKQMIQLYYFFVRHKYLWLGIYHNNRLPRLEKLVRSSDKILIVRNLDDAYTSPSFEKIARKWPNIVFVELPGIHDHFSVEPEPYIKLIKKYTK